VNKTASTRPAPSEKTGGDTLFRAHAWSLHPVLSEGAGLFELHPVGVYLVSP